MSQETKFKINNLVIALAEVRTIEKKLQDMSKRDETTVSEIRREGAEFKHRQGNFDKEFQEFLRDEGLQENFHLLDLVDLIWKKASKTLIV